jgi:hypothetical protein
MSGMVLAASGRRLDRVGVRRELNPDPLSTAVVVDAPPGGEVLYDPQPGSVAVLALAQAWCHRRLVDGGNSDPVPVCMEFEQQAAASMNYRVGH